MAVPTAAPATTQAPGQQHLTRARRAAEVSSLRAKRLSHALGLPGFLAVVALLFGELFAQELQLVLDTHTKTIAALVALAALMVLLAYRWSARLPGASTSVAYGNSGTEKLSTRRAAIVLLGLDSAHPDSAAAALFAATPTLEYLALVGTRETAQMGVSTRLLTQVGPAAGLNVPEARTRVWEFGNAESVADTEQATAEAIRWLIGRGLDPAEIVLDVSAGRRAMGYGAKDAADDAAVEAQYLAARWEPVTNRPVLGSSMFKIIKSYH